MEDIGHFRVGKEGRPLTILQVTDLHHFPAGTTEFDVRKIAHDPLHSDHDRDFRGSASP